MMYYKIINDRMVFSDCKTIHKQDGTWVSNPDAQTIANEGWQVYVPPIVPPQPQTEPGLAEVMQAVKRMLSTETSTLSDEDALDVAAMFPTWVSKLPKDPLNPQPSDTLQIGARVWYDGKLWKVTQAHVPQRDWTPDATPALYTDVSIVEFPEWRQPLGSEDGYDLGDKVSHNGLHWQSTHDGKNVWEPGVYGWTEV